MRRPFKWDVKYLHWGITAFCVIAFSIVFFMALRYLPLLGRALSALVKILSPFIWGLVLTYLLSPLMVRLEKSLFMPFTGWLYRKSKKHTGKKLARALSVITCVIVLLAILAALVYLIIPQLYQSLQTIVATSSTYIENATVWLTRMLEDFPQIEDYATQVLGNVNTWFTNWVKDSVLPGLGEMVTNITTGLYYALTAIYNLVVGIIVSCYLLADNEKFKANSLKLLYSVFSVTAAKKLLDGLKFTDRTFMGFILGKLLDSLIIGLLCYIGCTLMRMPYSLLVSVIVGVTNIIPFFGPIIGAIPGTLIILLVDPLKGLLFVAFVVLLQQLDGNFIGPKILGSSIGISGFWVMFSIVVGAGLFGFWGMLLGVPVFVVIYTLINARMDKNLKEHGLPWETGDYIGMDHIDPDTKQPVKRPEDTGSSQ